MKILEIIPLERHSNWQGPLFLNHVPAGFPSPADDYLSKALDLNELLVRHPDATFFCKAEGESMIRAGIHDGDILIVDRSLTPKHNKVVVAVLNGELTVKRLHKEKGRLALIAENSKYPPIEVVPDMDFLVWGVVTNVIHPL